MSIAFIVRGSEDGNLGVYSTKERARVKAVAYVAQSGSDTPTISVTKESWKEGDSVMEKYHSVVASRHNVSKALTERMFVSVEGNGVQADIEAFYVNS